MKKGRGRERGGVVSFLTSWVSVSLLEIIRHVSSGLEINLKSFSAIAAKIKQSLRIQY